MLAGAANGAATTDRRVINVRDLHNKVAVVTGAANGLGLGIATKFAQEGMRVVLSDVAEDDLATAVSSLRASGADVIGVRCDVSDADQVQALADATVAEYGQVHVLVNNAGVGGLQRFAKTSQATWEWTLGVNLWGPIHGCRIFLPLLAEAEEAHIVNTSSVGGFMAAPYLEPYFVSKAGIIALSECLSQEFEIEYPNIGVSVLCPANTATAIRNDERNAPVGHVRRADADPDLEERREHTNQLNEAGMSPLEAAQIVVDGIRAKKLYIFTHPEFMEYVRPRFDGIFEAAASAVDDAARHGDPTRQDRRPDQAQSPDTAPAT